jgi:hypothetical protein
LRKQPSNRKPETKFGEGLMKKENGIDKTILRTRQYWYEDGLTELAFGVACLLLALYFYLQVITSPESTLATLLNSSMVLIIVGIILLTRYLVNWLKARLTYPRTGFVSYQKSSGKQRWLAGGLAMLISAIVAAMMLNEPASLAWMPAVTGLLIGAAMLYFAYRLGLLRFYLLSFAAILIGPGLSFAGIGNLPGLSWFYALFGLVFLVSGGLTLRSYLKRTEVG